MRIRLDDIVLALGEDVIGEGKEAIYNEAKRIAVENNSVIVDIIVDGESVSDENVFFTLSGGIDIRFVSQPIRNLVPESLAEGERYLVRLIEGLETVATLFEQGRDQDALSRFAKCVEGIDWLVSVFGKCCLLLSIDRDVFNAGDYEEFTSDFNKTQSEILSSMEEGKNMRVAFLIRDTLIPMIERFSGFWDEVKEHVETPLQ
jgi:hypothetical protein